MKLTFHGATQQVTGSQFHLQISGLNILIDCGLFQERLYQERNWLPFGCEPGEVDYLILTHAHLDHTGLIPRLGVQGFSGSIICTHPTASLLPIVLMDAAKLQTEDLAFKQQRHRRAHRVSPHPYRPLYTIEDVNPVLERLKPIEYNQKFRLNEQTSLCFHDAGHILGSAMVEINVEQKNDQVKFIFSGDIGQWDRPLMRNPTTIDYADYIIMESTYGDRNHDASHSIQDDLREIVNATLDRGGNIVIPAFAIEKTQEILYHLHALLSRNEIPNTFIFVDSPMATKVTDIFRMFSRFLDEETNQLIDRGSDPLNYPGLTMVRSIAESKAINRIRGGCIIIAGSGMCTGGRVKHHLANNITRPESTILFVGFQAQHTLGRQILDRQPHVRILGQQYEVRAEIKQIQRLSAHADRGELIHWLGNLKSPPKQIFLVHGEEKAALSLADHIQQRMGLPVQVPAYRQEFKL